MRRLRKYAISIGVMLVALAAPARAAAPPNNIVVNTPQDAVRDDGHCSLREAITAANTDTPSGSKKGECPSGDADDIIHLKKDTTYALTRPGDVDEDANADGDLDITTNIQIKGRPGSVIAQHAKGQRVLHQVSSDFVAIDHVKITGGHPGAPRSNGDPSLSGGGILSAGNLKLDHVVVSGNHGGDAEFKIPPIPGGGSGGGIYHTGAQPLQILSSKIERNTAGAAAESGPFSQAQRGGLGGGVADFSLEQLVVDSSSISNNRAGRGGAGTQSATFTSPDGGAGGTGGGLYLGTDAFLQGVTIAGNRAGDGGAAGPGDPDLANSNGGNGGNGGAGGGIELQLNFLLELDRSTVSGNKAGVGGTGGRPGGAGGVAGVPGADANGGGLDMHGPATITNVTVSGNSSSSGGGISSDSAAVTLNDVTIADNHGTAEGGGYFRGATGSATLSNTLLGTNDAPLGNDCSGSFTGDHYNLVQDVTGCTGFTGTDITGANPRVAPLDNNGGGLKTHALKNDSPAVDAGNPAAPSFTPPACIPYDERVRLRNGRCDIGAFELGGERI